MSRRALNLLRPDIVYRKAAFDAGLQAVGFDVVSDLPDPKPGDVLLIWNRYGVFHIRACQFEAAGAQVLVTENGYLGKSWLGDEWFALALGHHNGAGSWRDLGPERWDSFGVELAPWTHGTRYPVILLQRGIGEQGVAMPANWMHTATHFYPKARVRSHPGLERRKDDVPLEEDLHDSSFAITWGSGAAIKALVLGIPVVHGLKQWIGAPAAAFFNQPRVTPDRLPMFRRLAWAQWRLAEIASGLPFKILCTS